MTLVVAYLGWDDYNYQAVSALQTGVWQDWLGSCPRWWNIQFKVNLTQVGDHQSRPVFLCTLSFEMAAQDAQAIH